MSPAELSRARQLVGRLPAKVRVELDVVLDAYAAAFPDRVTDAGARADLEALLRAAAADGQLQLPAEPGRSWDRSALPALPRFVSRPQLRTAAPAAVSATRRLRSRVWHERLGFVYELGRVSDAQLDDLEAVDRWLRAGGPQRQVPREERSLQVFGDEKHIKGRIGGSELWQEGRIDEQLLACFAPVPPMPTVTFADSGTLLVVENRATFWSMLEVLEPDPGGIAALGWGQGNYLPTLIPSLRLLPVEVRRCLYFGDLDAGGLTIAAAAADAAEHEGLPRWEPATALYRLLSDHAVEARGPVRSAQDAAHLAFWLADEDLRTWAAQLLASGRRASQEAVGLELLATDDRWRSMVR